MGNDWDGELLLRLQRMGAQIQEQPPGMLLARLAVRGGVFRHPLTRQPVDYFLFYPAGPNRVKILWPRFLWSMEYLELDPGWSAEAFFAAVASRLGAILQQLDAIRRKLASLGLVAELEREVLQLRGNVELAKHRVELVADRRGRVTLVKIDDQPLEGIEVSSRSYILSGTGLKDLDELSALTQRLAQRMIEDSGVIQLTEEVVEPSGESWLSVGELADKLGPSARFCVIAGMLHFQVVLKVVQGEYLFWLQHKPPSFFYGRMQTPSGQQVEVSFELDKIMDLKEVLDSYLRAY